MSWDRLGAGQRSVDAAQRGAWRGFVAMKITFNWLKEYVDFDWSPEQLGERLTMLGVELEGIHKLGGEFDGVVVAQILKSEKHPNADKLSVCRVADGSGERQIVCGAKNYAVGDKVPLVLPE